MAGVRQGTVYVEVQADFTAFDKQMAAAGKRAQDAINKAQQAGSKGVSQATAKATAEQTKAAEKAAAAQAKAAQKGQQAQVTAATKGAQQVAKVQQTEAQRAAQLQQRLQDRLQRDAQVAAQKLAQQKLALEQKTNAALAKSDAMHQQRRIQAQTKAADTAARAEERAGQRTQLTWQNVFKRVAMYSVAWVGVQGAFRFLGGAVTEAGRFQDEVSKATQVYGRSSKQMVEWAKGSAHAMGLSQTAALEAAGQFGTMAKLLGKSEPEVVNWSQTLTQLAGDMASFDGGPVSEAITAISAALRGEQEPIKRYGVLLDDFTLKQRALQMGLVKTTVGVLPPAIRAQAAYSVILEQTALKQRDYARTADQYANTQRTFSATIGNLRQAIGDQLLPVVTSLFEQATEMAEMFTALSPTTQKWVLIITAGAIAIIPLVKGLAALNKMIIETKISMVAWKEGGIAGMMSKISIGTVALTGAMIALGAAFAYVASQQAKASSKIAAAMDRGGKEDLSNIDAQRNRILELNDTLQRQAQTAPRTGRIPGTDRTTVTSTGDAQKVRDMVEAQKQFDKLDSTYKTMQNRLDGLSTRFSLTTQQASVLAQHFGIDLTEPIDNVAFKFAQATGKTDAFAASTDLLTASTLKYAEGVATALDPFLKSEQAHIAYQQSLIDTDTAMKTYNETQDHTKQQELDMQSAVVGMVGAWGTEYDALKAQNASQGELQASQDAMIGKLTEMATHVDGPVKTAILNLAAQIRDVPREWKTEMNANNNASAPIDDVKTSLKDLMEQVGLPTAGGPGFLDKVLQGLPLFARGGTLPVYEAGSGGGEVNQWTAVVGEGNAPEFVIPTEKKYRRRAIDLMTEASQYLGIAGLRGGGVIEPMIPKAADAVGERAKKIAENLYKLVKMYGGKGRTAANFAMQQVGKPYVWGASGPNAFDCSGLTMASWASAGVGIPRVSHDQIAAARAMGMADAVKSPGALFYTHSAGSPSGGHIAISNGDGHLTNARGVATGVTTTGPFGGLQGMPVYDSGGMSVGPGVFRAYQDEIHLPLDDKRTLDALTTAMTKAGGKQITVNANTNASPRAIADEIAWATR